MMPERQRSDQVNLNNSQKTTELLPQKHKKIMAFPPIATFGQLFPFQTSFEETFLIAGNRSKSLVLTTKDASAIDARESKWRLGLSAHHAQHTKIFRARVLQ